ncbi:MAG: pirin family protein, partial [Rhodocyclaceae bacterium]|jgi:redox-sensitive bicupin YhaK (pirin superfamily)|nr:pirin family protein [Rhodocyclaceae bacterium]MCA3074216.1 pirin family protein [Rhodocyclaceae bacterium]MCA3090901.1 pirin family protein [Rhodocyclaceae bacterium]MCA3095063.1 pirin family protein [Rhodocyclaceae bacterium]MCA3099406.1 pirin family protein [Rhodocyclaceae bacterium]
MELLLKPHVKDLGGFSVRRLLPAQAIRTIGPFIFFDHMGPAAFAPGDGIDVRPHPHIGLATVTYLFDGALMHRDSLGFVQRIEPGAVNWMTAGDGIVHSERSDPSDRAAGHRLHGIQTWIALPRAAERTAPSFVHVPADRLPSFEESSVQLRLIAGDALGLRSPVPVHSPMFYLAAVFRPGGRFVLPAEYAERGIYLVEGNLDIDGEALPPQHVAVTAAGQPVLLESQQGCTAMLFGGAPLDGERFIWWNFVASSRELIESAKDRWTRQQMGQVPGETEFIPLPAQ